MKENDQINKSLEYLMGKGIKVPKNLSAKYVAYGDDKNGS